MPAAAAVAGLCGQPGSRAAGGSRRHQYHRYEGGGLTVRRPVGAGAQEVRRVVFRHRQLLRRRDFQRLHRRGDHRQPLHRTARGKRPVAGLPAWQDHLHRGLHQQRGKRLHLGHHVVWPQPGHVRRPDHGQLRLFTGLGHRRQARRRRVLRESHAPQLSGGPQPGADAIHAAVAQLRVHHPAGIPAQPLRSMRFNTPGTATATAPRYTRRRAPAMPGPRG